MNVYEKNDTIIENIYINADEILNKNEDMAFAKMQLCRSKQVR